MLYVLLFFAAFPGIVFVIGIIAHAREYKRFLYADDLREFRESAAYKAITDLHERWRAEVEFSHRQAQRFGGPRG